MPALETMESVLVALSRASWQASWLILLVLVAQVTLRRWLSPAWRSALWLLVVARLLLPVTPSSAWSLFNLTSHFDALRAMALHPPAAVEANAHRSAGLRHGDVEPSYPFQHADLREAGTPATIPPGAPFQAAINDPALREGPLAPVPVATVQASKGSFLPILFWIWLTAYRSSVPALLPAPACSHDASDATRWCPIAGLPSSSRNRVKSSDAPRTCARGNRRRDSPALFGLGPWPKLLLPTGLIRRLNESDLRHVFLHEQAHLRRHDVLLNWLAALLQIIHWFNPVVWFGFARMRADREFACDALALSRSAGIDRRAAYGTTILKLVSDLTPRRQAAGLVGISEGKAHLKRRLRNIASHRTPTRWTTVMGALALFLLTGMTLTDARAIRGVSELSAEAEKTALAQVESQPQSVAVPTPDTSAPANQVKGGSGWQRIEAKLQRIVLDEVQFDGLTLPDVLRYLGEVVRQLDPDQVGINFLINPQLPTAPETPVVDPATGQVIPVPQWEPMDMNRVKIRIAPALRHVRLGDLLEAITRGADRPIAYSIEEYAIVFTPRPPELGVQLETRIYKVDPARLLAGIRATRPPGSEDPDRNPQEQVRDYLRDAGISVLPPNQVYFNDRKGVLMVRATDSELKLIENAIELSGKTAPQGSTPPRNADDGASTESGEQRALETRIFRINVEKLIESQRRLGPAENLKEHIPNDDSSVGIRADSEESSDGLLFWPRVFELDDVTADSVPGVTSTNVTERGREVHLALRRFLRMADVSVLPPNGIYFADRRGVLMARATSRELDNLQEALDSLDGPGLRVRLAVRAIELDRIGAARSRDLGLDWFRGPRQAVGILTERQSATVLAALEPQLGEALVSVSSATAPHDRWTRVAWRSTMGREIILDCRPVVKLDGVTIELTGTIHVGGIESGEAKPFVAPNPAVPIPRNPPGARWSGPGKP